MQSNDLGSMQSFKLLISYIWELECEESWALKNWCFWTVVLEKTHESPLACKEIKSVHPKGDQSWVSIGRTDTEAKAPILYLHDVIRKDPDATKDWRWEEKGTTEDEMVGYYHWLNGHEFEQAPGDSEGQRGLVCCSPWGHKESDTAEWLNSKNSGSTPVSRFIRSSQPVDQHSTWITSS